MLRKYLQNLANSKILRSDKVSSTLKSLGWKYENGKLNKHFQFGCYEDSSFFISRYTAYCEKINHTPKCPYPQLTKNQQLSVRDIQLARYLDRIGGLDLELSSQRDYYRHQSIAISTKQLYNDQKKPTRCKQFQILNFDTQLVGRDLLSLQSQNATDTYRKDETQLLGIEDFLTQVPSSRSDKQIDRLQLQGKKRIEQLQTRNYTQMINYNQGFASQQYLSDPELDLKTESSQALIEQSSQPSSEAEDKTLDQSK